MNLSALKSLAPYGAGLIALIAIMAPKSLAVMLPLLALAILSRRQFQKWDKADFILIALALWAALSNFSAAAQLSAILLAGIFIWRQSAVFKIDATAESGLMLGFLAALFVLAFEIATHGLAWRALSGQEYLFNLNVYNRSTSVLALFMWPWLLLLRRQEVKAPLPLAWALIAAIIWQLDNATAKLALASASIIFVASLYAPLLLRRLMVIGAVTMIIAAPYLAAHFLNPAAEWTKHLPYSAQYRLHIWQFASERIAEKPLTGWGMDRARDIPGGQELFNIAPPPGSFEYFVGQPPLKMPLHPHNASLQIWLELGAMGAVLAAAAFALYAWPRKKYGAFEMAAANAMLVAGLGMAHLSYGLWQSWWLSAFIVAAFFYSQFAGGKNE
ncbi:MAG: O-antigen ligase family protein [Dongiaceae bacterium]